MALLESDPTIQRVLGYVEEPWGKLTRADFLNQLRLMKAGTWAEQPEAFVPSMLAGRACQLFALWRFTDKGIVLTARGQRVFKALSEEEQSNPDPSEWGTITEPKPSPWARLFLGRKNS